jgi:hypothetical protein
MRRHGKCRDADDARHRRRRKAAFMLDRKKSRGRIAAKGLSQPDKQGSNAFAGSRMYCSI